ncbi:MAG: VWA domain-containing protein [Phycisphaerales bacterium]|nr:VWA domain-containing protein [Phycisphaerales bacterium]
MNHEPTSNLNETAAPKPDVYEVLAEESRHTSQYRKPEKVIAPAVSIFLHALFLLIAAILVINPPIRGDGEVQIEFATLAEEELTKLDDPSDAIPTPMDPSLTVSAESPAELFEADPASVSVDLADPGAVDTLGGAGEDFSPGQMLGGGGAGTSFFGIEARGNRFVYIVDVSGSMSEADRIGTLQRNLVESINALPEHASFLIIAYSDNAFAMNDQYRWYKADEQTKFKVRAWISRLVSAGGTEPAPAFEEAFKLKPRPDIIYFMTDGQQTEVLPGFVRALNTRGRRTKINTIIFGSRGGEEIMRQIAKESGGEYRYVPDFGVPNPGGGGGPP